MKILFIGYSNLVKRRIIPFLKEINGIDAVDIARYDDQINVEVTGVELPFRVFSSYEEAIEKSDAELAYVSTVNSAHDTWCEKALLRGMHVVVDKPAFSDYKRSIELIGLSEKLNLGLAEATVYTCHSQIRTVLDIIEREQLEPLGLTINFAFPKLDPANFRYNKSLGGGALNDLGPYVVSAGRTFFREVPLNAYGVINSYTSNNQADRVETSFSVLLKYSNGRSLTGQFGFNSEYINRINVSGENFYFEINRAFTPPHDINNEIKLRRLNETKEIQTGISNSFVNFLNAFITSLEKNELSSYKATLLQDAEALNMLKQNCF